jgi:hypothetical protein
MSKVISPEQNTHRSGAMSLQSLLPRRKGGQRVALLDGIA